MDAVTIKDLGDVEAGSVEHHRVDPWRDEVDPGVGTGGAAPESRSCHRSEQSVAGEVDREVIGAGFNQACALLRLRPSDVLGTGHALILPLGSHP